MQQEFETRHQEEEEERGGGPLTFSIVLPQAYRLLWKVPFIPTPRSRFVYRPGALRERRGPDSLTESQARDENQTVGEVLKARLARLHAAAPSALRHTTTK